MSNDISRLMDGANFRTKIRNFCEECSFQVDSITDDLAIFDVGTHLCFIESRKVERRPLMIKFIFPVPIKIGHMNTLDPLLSTVLLKRNNGHWIGAWCIEEREDDEISFSCVYTTELDHLSVGKFYDIALLMSGECAKFTEMYRGQRRLT